MIRLIVGSAVTLPVLGLLVSGCHLIGWGSNDQPAGAESAHLFSTEPMPAAIEDDHISVRAGINGHEVRLLLDTGASHVLLSTEAAAAAGVEKSRKVQIGAFGKGQGDAHVGVADSVSVGPALAEKVDVAIARLPLPFHDDGLLGLSFLRQFTFRLDYQRGLVSFASPKNNTLTGNGSSVPLQDEGRALVIPAEVDGIPARLVVDTGAGQALILRSWFVEQHKLRERYPRRLNIVTGVGLLGQMRGEIARVQTLELGDYAVTNVFAEFETTTNTWPGDVAGFIGAPILRRFNLAFDIAGRRLWLEPNARFATGSTLRGSVRSGFVCLPEGKSWIVRDLIPGSPAAEAGVHLGDQLLEINGVSVQALKIEEIKRAFRARPGTHVRLRLQTGEESPREVTLILRDLL